jgi:hypothetical protein
MKYLISFFYMCGLLTFSQGFEISQVKDMLTCLNIRENQGSDVRELVISMLKQNPESACPCIVKSFPHLEVVSLKNDYTLYCEDSVRRRVLGTDIIARDRHEHGGGRKHDDKEEDDAEDDANDDHPKKSNEREEEDEKRRNKKDETRFALYGGQ